MAAVDCFLCGAVGFVRTRRVVRNHREGWEHFCLCCHFTWSAAGVHELATSASRAVGHSNERRGDGRTQRNRRRPPATARRPRWARRRAAALDPRIVSILQRTTC